MAKFFRKQLFSNTDSKLTKDDLVEVSLTADGTYVFEGQSECIELTFDELMILHKALGLEIARIKSYLEIE